MPTLYLGRIFLVSTGLTILFQLLSNDIKQVVLMVMFSVLVATFPLYWRSQPKPK